MRPVTDGTGLPPPPDDHSHFRREVKRWAVALFSSELLEIRLIRLMSKWEAKPFRNYSTV